MRRLLLIPAGAAIAYFVLVAAYQTWTELAERAGDRELEARRLWDEATDPRFGRVARRARLRVVGAAS